VNALRPGNIKVVMAVGDSISAGFAMHSGPFWDLELIEYRGDVFSIGGDPGQFTLPNFLMNYNPNITGASVGWSFPFDAITWINNSIIQPWDAPVTHLNGAQSHAQINQVPSQIDYITEQILTTYNETINMEEDWKIMTIFIGANNLCSACANTSVSQPDYFENLLRISIEKIYKQLPRTFVNIVPMFNISQVYNISMGSDYCEFMWYALTSHECGCLTDNSTEEMRKAMDIHGTHFNERMFKVAAEWQAKNLANFTVVVQPFTQNMVIPPSFGIYFLSELDCFHPSFLADAAWAISLWNNMLTPQGKKATNVPIDLEFVCPDENSVFQ